MANKSGIHINPKNKGKFTAKAKKAGMSVQAFASHVKAHPDNYSGKTRQEANFASVAKKKFKHQAGGKLPPVTVTSDRFKKYQDSLDLYNMSQHIARDANDFYNNGKKFETFEEMSKKGNVPASEIQKKLFKQAYDDFQYYGGGNGGHVPNDYIGRNMVNKAKATGIMPIGALPGEGEQDFLEFAKPTRPSLSRSGIGQRAKIGEGAGEIEAPRVGRLPEAGGRTNFSFSGRDENGQPVTRYLPDFDAWRRATDDMGYNHREYNNDSTEAHATGYQFQTGGQVQLAQVTPGATSIADRYPTIDGSFDPLDQMGAHAEDQTTAGPATPQQLAKQYYQNGNRINPYIKDFNLAAAGVTDVANKIGNNKQKKQEYLQTLQSMTPKFMSNTNSNGLNNTPAYTMFGGPDRAMPSMSLGGDPNWLMMYGGVGGDGTFDYYDGSEKTNLDYGYEGIAHKNGPVYGHTSLYRNGGEVSSDKAKEILHDGTIHGHPITDRQRRYFGWIAGGKKAMVGVNVRFQAGGAPSQSTPITGAANVEDYYRSSAQLSYYKDKLNAKLKAKNPQAYGDYFKGLVDKRRAGDQQGAQDYVQNSQYNDYLTPEEVKSTLGSDQDYQNYLNSLKAVNQYNVSQGKQPLYGNIEGQSDDPTKLNYGRRFASLQVTPSFSKTLTGSNGNSNYSRRYQYNPQSGQVDFTETGDLGLRPGGFSVPGQQQQPMPAPTDSTSTVSRKYGGRKYQTGGVQPRYRFAPGFTPTAADSADYRQDFQTALQGKDDNSIMKKFMGTSVPTLYNRMKRGETPGIVGSIPNDPRTLLARQLQANTFDAWQDAIEPDSFNGTAQLYLPKDTVVPPKHQAGGYEVGQTIDLTPKQIQDLRKKGYKIKMA